MPKHHTRGGLGPDGVTRYYVPSQNAWFTREQIEAQNKAERQADKIASIFMPITVSGALLFILIITLSAL